MFECCEEQVDWTAALATLQLQDCRGGCGLLQAAPAAVLQSQLPQTTSSPPPATPATLLPSSPPPPPQTKAEKGRRGGGWWSDWGRGEGVARHTQTVIDIQSVCSSFCSAPQLTTYNNPDWAVGREGGKGGAGLSVSTFENNNNNI